VSDQQTAQFQCLTPVSLVARRISDCALTNYLNAILAELQARFENSSLSECSFQVSILLSKDTQPVFEVQHFGLPPEHLNLRDELENELPKVAWPSLHSGAVGMVIQLFHEGMSQGQVEFFEPFTYLSPQVVQKNRSAIDISRGRVIPKTEIEEFYEFVSIQRSWWKRMSDWFTGQQPKSSVVSRPEPDAPLLNESFEHLRHAQINQMVNEHTNRIEPLIARAQWHSAHDDDEEAIEDYNTAIEMNAEEPRLFHLRGCCFASIGNTAQALADIENAIEMSDRFSRARFSRARLLVELGAYDEAHEELKRCVLLRPFEPDYRMLLSRLLMQSGETQAALEEAEQINSLDPHCPTSIGWIAFLNRQLNRFDNPAMRVAELTRAVNLDPNTSPVRFERAIWQSIVGDWKSVVSDCDVLLSEIGSNAEAFALRASGNFELGELEQAKADVEQAIELGNTTPQVLTTRVRCDLAAGETATVLEQLDSILVEAPEYLFAICLKGDYFGSIGELEGALGCYRDALRLAPENALVLEKMSYVLCELGQTSESLEACDKCLEIDSSIPQFHFTRSWLSLQVNQLDDAMASIDTAIQLDPQNPAVYFQRANILLAMTNRSEAIEDLNRAIEIAPDYGEAVELRGRLHRDDTNFELAEQDYNSLVNQFPDNFYAYALRASLRTQMGQDNLASSDLRTAIEMNPGAAEAMLLQQEMTRADAHFRNEEYDQAIEVYSEIIGNDNDCLPAFIYRASSYWYSEQFVEALDDYARVLQIVDDHDGDSRQLRLSTLGSRGQVFAELGEYEQAIQDLDQVIQADSKDAGPIAKAYALNGRGLANAGLAKIEDAERDFRNSISIAPDNSWVHYNQGLCYFRQERLKEAKRCFELAIELTNPKLTPRKRKKAESFLRSCSV
jgi:tetratricopeptide (TPR) repeat protein